MCLYVFCVFSRVYVFFFTTHKYDTNYLIFVRHEKWEACIILYNATLTVAT